MALKYCKGCEQKSNEKFTFCPYCGEELIKNSDSSLKPIPMKEYAPVVLFEQLKTKFPEHILFIQNGRFYELYGSDARECNNLFGWKIIEKCGLDFTGVPHWSLKFKEKLKSLNKSFIIVESYIENEYLKRKVVEISPYN
jgi:DNA mismatch repair ATPase MutS